MSLITQFREKDFTKGFNHYNGVFEKTGIYFDILLMEENKKIEISCYKEKNIQKMIKNRKKLEKGKKLGARSGWGGKEGRVGWAGRAGGTGVIWPGRRPGGLEADIRCRPRRPARPLEPGR